MAAKYFDEETGEIRAEPEFVKIYIRDLCAVKGLNSTQYKIFNFMLSNMNADNIVGYGSRTRESFLDKNKIKPQTFNNNVNGLIESGLIKRIGRGEFLINKKYAAKVDWSKVQSIRWSSTYNLDGTKEEEVSFN